MNIRYAVLAAAVIVHATGVCGGEDLYGELGIDRSASRKDIKRAYMKLSKEYHPDHNSEDWAKEKYRKIRDAYDVLSSPDKRAEYDSQGYWVGKKRAAFMRADPIYSSTVDLGSYNWEHRLSEGPWVVWFYSDDSHACQTFVFTWDSLASDMDSLLQFGRVNTITERPLTAQYSVTRVPTVIFFPGDGSHVVIPNPPTPDAILDAYMEMFPFNIPWVTSETLQGFLNTRPHLVKMLYFVAERGESDRTYEGIPLDLIRFHKDFADTIDIGVVAAGAKELLEKYKVMPWGRTIVMIQDNGREVKRKSGGLRPYESIKKFVEGHSWNTVPKMTEKAKVRCQGDEGSVCAVLGFPSGMTWGEKDGYLKAFGDSNKFGTATKVWVNIEPQIDTLRALKVWTTLEHPTVVVFSTHYTEMATEFRQFETLEEFEAIGGEWVTEKTHELRMQHVSTKLRPDKYNFIIAPEDSDTNQPPTDYFKFAYKIYKKLKAFNFDSMLWMLLIAYVLRRVNVPDPKHTATPNPPRRSASVAPHVPSTPTKWSPLAPHHFTRNIVLVCLVPNKLDVKKIRVPEVAIDRRIQLAYVTEAQATGNWHAFFAADTSCITVVCVRGSSKKYSIFARGKASDPKWGAGKELQTKLDDLVAGSMLTEDFVKVPDWPSGKGWFCEGEPM